MPSLNLAARFLPLSIFVALFAFIPLIGVLAPRPMAFLPPLVALIGWGAFYLQTKTWPVLKKETIAWALGFAGLFALSSLWAMDTEITWDRLGKAAPIFLGMILIVALINVLRSEYQEKFFAISRIVLIIAGLFIIEELLSKGFILRQIHDTERFVDLSFINRSVVIYFFCALPLFIKTRFETLDYILGGVFLLTVLLTESQSTQLAFLIFAVVRWLIPLRSKITWILAGIFLSTSILSIPFVAPFLYKNYAKPIKEISWLRRNAYPHERMEIWDFVSRRALEKPFLGHGIEATRLTNDFDSANKYRRDGNVLHPHNVALQIWIEFGALGTFIFIGFVCRLLYKIRKIYEVNSEAGRFSLAVFLSLFTVASTAYGIWQGWWLGLFCYILGAVLLVVKSPLSVQGGK